MRLTRLDDGGLRHAGRDTSQASSTFFFLSYFTDYYYLLFISSYVYGTVTKGPNDGLYRRLGLDIFVTAGTSPRRPPHTITTTKTSTATR
jgi:hypothetical protein